MLGMTQNYICIWKDRNVKELVRVYDAQGVKELR